ncbi:hypothetical protein Scep_008914 [Stephania cephalantha]|uniref:Uncharacterized protein n=1 Tax=Stephania cephalantha TaxID=152367 RepID=A0AAP0JTL1_9MAGN
MVRFSYTPGEWASTNFYKPTRQDTEQALQNLRSLVVDRLGEFRPIVLLGVTDIVLWILKSDHHDFKTPTHKRAQLEKLLNPIADQVFEQMLQTTQLITDYSTHPYEFEFHNDRPLASMEAIVAYNLLVWAYRDWPWHRTPPPQQVYRKKAYEMVLILNNESAKSSDEQTKLIITLLYGVSGHMVVFYIVPAKNVDSRAGSSSIDVKVIDKLVVFDWIIPMSQRFWDNDDGADHEEEGDSGAFEESENKLRSAGASAPRDGPDHHRGEGIGDRPVEAEGSRSTDSRDHVEMKNGCSICRENPARSDRFLAPDLAEATGNGKERESMETERETPAGDLVASLTGSGLATGSAEREIRPREREREREIEKWRKEKDDDERGSYGGGATAVPAGVGARRSSQWRARGGGSTTRGMRTTRLVGGRRRAAKCGRRPGNETRGGGLDGRICISGARRRRWKWWRKSGGGRGRTVEVFVLILGVRVI